MVERGSPALTIGRTVAWLAASILLYIALAIAVYVPISSFGAPADRDSWSVAFYARLSAAIILHQAVSLATWLLLARWFGAPRMFALALSIVTIAFLGLASLSVLTARPG